MKKIIENLFRMDGGKDERKFFQDLISYLEEDDAKNITDIEEVYFIQHKFKQKNIGDTFDYDLGFVERFVHWLFTKRFGWMEKCNLDSSNDFTKQDFSITLDKLIFWLENHQHLSYYILHGYKCAFKSNISLPIVRKQINKSIFRWLRNLSIKCVICPEKCFSTIQNIVILGLTDVWSAIRKDTASQLCVLVELINLSQLEKLFTKLMQMCCISEKVQGRDDWQTVDGAIKGIEKILSSCKWVALSSVRKDANGSSPSALIKIGRLSFIGLPSFMSIELESMLFGLFANPQLSIRESSARAFSILVNKVEYTHFVELFEKLVGRLKSFVPENGAECCMDPYEAEGYINVVIFLIKKVPLSYLLSKWHFYWSIFTYYLMHSAAIVRQTTSVIFKYFVSKEQTSTNLMKIILQDLCCSWKVDAGSPRDSSLTWQWREGRMLAYELVLKFLLTNHTYCTTSSERRPSLSSNLSASTDQFNIQSMPKPHNPRKLTKSFTICGVQSKKLALIQPKIKEVQSLIMLLVEEQNSTEKTSTSNNLENVKFSQFPEFSGNQQLFERLSLEWLHQQTCAPWNQLIRQIHLQIMECIVDDVWELRRMAFQLLPLVCELMYVTQYDVMKDFTATAYSDYLTLFHTLKKIDHIQKNNTKYEFLEYHQNVLESLSTICEDIAETLDHLNDEVLELSIALLVLGSNLCEKDLVSSCVRDNVSRQLYAMFLAIEKSEDAREKKKLLNVISRCEPHLVDYCVSTEAQLSILLLPVLLKVALITNQESLHLETVFLCCNSILSNIEVVSDHTYPHLSKGCQLACEFLRRSDILNIQALFKTVCSMQLLLKDDFPLQKFTDVLQSKLDTLNDDVDAEMYTELTDASRTQHETRLPSADRVSPFDSDGSEISDWDWSSDDADETFTSKEFLNDFLDQLVNNGKAEQ